MLRLKKSLHIALCALRGRAKRGFNRNDCRCKIIRHGCAGFGLIRIWGINLNR
jgi:hypothetical protein